MIIHMINWPYFSIETIIKINSNYSPPKSVTTAYEFGTFLKTPTANYLCTDICKTIFVILEVQFHHKGGLSKTCYFEFFFHQTNIQHLLRPPSIFSEHWIWFWPYWFSEKGMQLCWYKFWVIFWSKIHLLLLRGVFFTEKQACTFVHFLYILEPYWTP